MDEQAIFTALPGGREDGRLRVTVFVTPRLTVPAGAGQVPLAESEAFADWPRTVRDAGWEFELEGVGTFPGEFVDPHVEPDSELWMRLFGDTAVGQATFQHFEESIVHSYPVEEVVRAIREVYATAATKHATDFPPVTHGVLKDALDELGPGWIVPELGHGDRRIAVREYLRRLREDSDPASGGAGTPARARYLDLDAVPAADRPRTALLAATGFYDRAANPNDPANATRPAPEPVAPEFHSFVARCADHEDLLRRLGLAIDLSIEDPGVSERGTRIRVVHVQSDEPIAHLAAADPSRPWTRVHYSDRAWAPMIDREQPDIVDGSLVIDDPERFLVDQVDPDGMSLKFASLLDTIARTVADLDATPATALQMPSMTDDASSLPALRSNGIVIARRNRAKHLVAQFEQSADHEADRTGSPTPTTLDATDVTRGWRVDVLDLDAPEHAWRSLHEREGEFRLVRPAQPSEPLVLDPPHVRDEGYLKAASTSSEEAATTADQYLHETLAGWDGWSLAVTRPGLKQTETDTVQADEAPDVAGTGFPLAARFHVPGGSLPRLRFGRSYRVRVRAVDLSAHSIPADQLDDAHERELDGPYLRWEPVPSPAVIPLTEFTEGESLMRMVIRSTLGETVSDYIALQRVRDLPGHEPSGRIGIVYREENERHLAPPITSVQLAETHGRFDAAFSGSPAEVQAQFDLIAARESETYLTMPNGRLVNPADRAPGQEFTFAKDDVLMQGEYIVRDTPQLALPYLPDPLSRGVSFTTLPGDEIDDTTGGTREQRWPGGPDWHDRLPFRLRVVEGDGVPDFDVPSRTLTVPLPKATLVTVRISSFLDAPDIDLMSIWSLVRAELQTAGAPASAIAEARELMRQGRHWMVTPYAELTLVHAVEKPLEPPEIALDAQQRRAHGETFSVLPGFVRTHAASTGRMDLEATWQEPVDDPLEPAPVFVPDPADPPPPGTPTPPVRHAHVADFPVTPIESQARIGRDAAGPAGPYGPRHEVRHEFGDTKHRMVDYTPIATTRFREYFPPKVTDDPDLVTHAGPALRVNVPSSRRPDPPDVHSIIPTWRWDEMPLRVGSRFGVRRVRSGGGLRVYLRRPWWSSGDDELLGVILRLQPWLDWFADLDAGVAGARALGPLAEGWATSVLTGLGLGRDEVAKADSASALLRSKLAEASAELVDGGDARAARSGILDGLRVTGGDGGRLRLEPGLAVDGNGRRVSVGPSPARPHPRDDAEHFLDRTASAIDRARIAEAGPIVEDAAASALIGSWLDLLLLHTSDEGRRFTSSWGTDPVFEGEPLPGGPFIHHFPLRVDVGHGTLVESATGASPSSDPVTVVGHRPAFDESRDLWYCDIQVDAGSAYTPFVQLALARYQRHSIPGEEISAVVKADFVQLVPRREATFVLSPDGDAIAVTLAGTVGVPKFAEHLGALTAQVAASRRVEAWIERLPEDATSDLDWEPVDAPTELPVRHLLTRLGILRPRHGDVEWAGAVAVPDRERGVRLRIRIAEYELHQIDPKGVWPPLAFKARGRRIVYADTVELP
ncbi:hypothetical protein [Agromyces kandeliae]|uniref:Uncharacterized protein n=1 Tax=Agromyces kandeliae TaxID=2666141 RepID=A0A6L5QWG3_9MICO|nr:hypothetical protein [Agromyces kandeliae]MRX42136.1 hypothetical protein [Agromyces kandeliae]